MIIYIFAAEKVKPNKMERECRTRERERVYYVYISIGKVYELISSVCICIIVIV